MPKEKRRRPVKPSRPRWVFDPDVPTEPWCTDQSLDDMWQLQEAVDNFVFWMERDEFLTWEAVVCEEQGLPLTPQQKDALGRLVGFGDPVEGDRVLYINEAPRPSERWDVILKCLVPHLLIEPFVTSDIKAEVQLEGWPQIIEAVRTHGGGLSLPADVDSPEQVVPDELRHKLWLQVCFDALSGLGQESEINLKMQPERVEWFIAELRKHQESVSFFGLTLETLLKRLVLPAADRPIFLEMMQKRLELPSLQEPIADHL